MLNFFKLSFELQKTTEKAANILEVPHSLPLFYTKQHSELGSR